MDLLEEVNEDDLTRIVSFERMELLPQLYELEGRTDAFGYEQDPCDISELSLDDLSEDE